MIGISIIQQVLNAIKKLREWRKRQVKIGRCDVQNVKRQPANTKSDLPKPVVKDTVVAFANADIRQSKRHKDTVKRFDKKPSRCMWMEMVRDEQGVSLVFITKP